MSTQWLIPREGKEGKLNNVTLVQQMHIQKLNK